MENTNVQEHKSADYIRNIIIENNDSIAFIIGNGIHRYTEIKGEQKRCSWDELLLELWNSSSLSKLEKIETGISNTEFYDLIELNRWKQDEAKRREEEKKRFFEMLRTLPSYDYKKMLSETAKLATVKAGKQSNSKEYYNKKNKELLSSLGNQNKKLAEKSRLFLSKYGVDVSTDKSDLLTLENVNSVLLAMRVLNEPYLNNTLCNRAKVEIAQRMKVWSSNPIIDSLILAIKKLDVPLLTTNFDDVFSKSINAKLHVMKDYNGKAKCTDWYPWNYYYGDEYTSPSYRFGIWHINGMVKYPRSIMLGLCDYTRSLERAREIIHGSAIFKCDSFEAINQDFGQVCNTWLHYIFKRSLFIFGLGLEENEVFLRWLLIQRAKYFSIRDRSLKGWYVVGPCDNVSNGKKLFLESVGFEIIRIDNYKTIYEDVWHSVMY